MPDILIEHARYLITMDVRRRIIKDGAIAIEGQRIVAVGKSEEVKRSFGKSGLVMDARSKVVLPGLINVHCHTNHQLARGLADNVLFPTWIHERVYPIESSLKPDEVHLSALACCIEAIKTGCTCLIDPGGYDMEQVVKAVEESGIRAVLARSAVDIHSPARTIPGKMREETDDAVRSSEEFVRNYNGMADGRIKAWFAPRTERMASDELLRRLDELADKYGTGITIHAASTQDSVLRHKELFQGRRPIERFHEVGLLGPNLLLGEANWITDEEIALLKEKDVKVFHIPTGSFHGGYGALHAKHLEMMKKGIVVGIGNDCAPESNFLDMFRVMYALIAKRDFHLDPTLVPPEQALEMAILNGAKAALWEREIGSLEVGKKADLIVVETKRHDWVPTHNPISNLVHSSCGDAVDSVIIDGRLVMEGRRILTLDEERVLEEAEEAAFKVAERSGVNRYASPRWPIV